MRYFFAILGLMFAFNVCAHEANAIQQKSTLEIGVTFDNTGNLWRASVKDDFVLVDVSKDLGKTFSIPVKVNQTPQKNSADGEARPKIAISPEGNIYLTWTEVLKTPFSGYVWFARSIDTGKTFEKPYVVHQDRAEITHRLEALNLALNGNITVSWVDKRDLIAAKAASKKYAGAAIYYAVSTNKGASFSAEHKLADNSCEYCRIATTNKPDGTVVAMWNSLLEGVEHDYLIAEIPQKNEVANLHRATFSHWKVDDCPHQGVALANGGEGKDLWGYHMVYFDGNDAKPGLYYSRMDGVAWASSPPKKIGDNTKQASHPAILSMSTEGGAENVWLAWREIKDGKSSIMGMFSDDGGRSWSEAKMLASSSHETDYPILIQDKQQPYLVWNVQQEGLIVKALK
jgi:hypothetical protein